MKITIDTTKKEIIVEESTSVSELISFLKQNDYNDYKIVSKTVTLTDFFEKKDWLNPLPYIPFEPYYTFDVPRTGYWSISDNRTVMTTTED